MVDGFVVDAVVVVLVGGVFVVAVVMYCVVTSAVVVGAGDGPVVGDVGGVVDAAVWMLV